MKLAKTHLAAFRLIAERQPVRVATRADYYPGEIYISARTMEALRTKGLLKTTSRGLTEVNPPRRFETQEAHQERVRAARRLLWSAVLELQAVIQKEWLLEIRRAYTVVGEMLDALEALCVQDVSHLPHDDVEADLAAFFAEQGEGK